MKIPKLETNNSWLLLMVSSYEALSFEKIKNQIPEKISKLETNNSKLAPHWPRKPRASSTPAFSCTMRLMAPTMRLGSRC
jgi:hypothetical protein